jgi:phage baseplate assembly protein gpV
MLKFGIISEVIASKGLARVKFDDDGIVSAPLHSSAPSTLDDQVQFPFNVNQHVWCMMDERCERGVIGGAIYDQGNGPAGGDSDIIRMKFQGGLEFKYDRGNNKLSIQGTGDIEINTTGKLDATVTDDAKVTCQNAKVTAHLEAEIIATTNIKLTAPTTIVSGALQCASIITTASPGGAGLHIDSSGNLKTSGSVEGSAVKEGIIQLGTHKHPGVTTGGGTSGTPIP